MRFEQALQARSIELENQYKARFLELENDYRQRKIELETKYQTQKMALAADLERQYNNALYDRAKAQNRINVNQNHPELGYRTEYPERWMEETAKMRQEQKFERDKADIINRNKLARINLEEEDATETLRRQLGMNEELKQAKTPEIGRAHV